jgi:hypothetical protein
MMTNQVTHKNDSLLVYPIITLMMQSVYTSETSVYFYETIRCYIPEGCHLQTHRCENLKSHTKVTHR